MKILTMMTLLSLSSAALAVEPQQVDLYLKATRGEAGAATNAYASLSQSLATAGTDPLTLVYAGSARTLMGREARDPATAGRLTSEGLALIRQALAATGDEQLARQHQGLREGDYINAIAAATLTSVPEFFGTHSQGLALFDGDADLPRGRGGVEVTRLPPLVGVAQIQLVHQQVQALQVVAHGQGGHAVDAGLEQLVGLAVAELGEHVTALLLGAGNQARQAAGHQQ